MGSKNKKSMIYQPSDTLIGKKINVTPKPEAEVGYDQSQEIIKQLLDGVAGDGLNIQKIDSFCSISQNRNSVYDLIDTMLEDPTIASVIEIYCEDATETNSKGQIMWAESSDEEVARYIQYLLNDLNIEKNIYRWANCLVKYGDVYLRLYHESEYEQDDLFEDEDKKKSTLNEDVVLTAFNKNDNFVHYLSMVSNPAEMFELTKFGKTYAYIQAPVTAYMSKVKDTNLAYGNYSYKFKKKDVHVFTADNFVHGCLDDLTSREPEEVNLSLTADDDEEAKIYTYNVKRGQSILYNTYKIWRQNMLLEYALLLNRLSRSSSVKIINVEVGDMPKNQVNAKLMAIKQLVEQKTALATSEGMNEYSNSGPAENIIYVAAHNGQGTITPQELTSDLNVSGLDDVNLFKTKLYSSLKIPKQYLGDTDDSAGFDGGTSLSLLSSRYAKTVKRIQNVLIQLVTDAINIMLIDKGYSNYINKFRLHMQEPTTREEVDRKDALVNRIAAVQETMSLFDDIQDPVARLTILKNLLGDVSTDAEILSEIDKQIDKLSTQEAQMPDEGAGFGGSSMTDTGNTLGGSFSGDLSGGIGDTTTEPFPNEGNGAETANGELPNPESLGVDLVNGTGL